MIMTNGGNINLYVPQGALYFGTSSIVSISNSKTLLSTPFSIAANVKIDSTDGLDHIAGRGYSYYFQTDANGSLSFYVYGGSGYSGAQIESSKWSLNKWYHLVGTYDTTSLNIYLDGILISSNTHPPASMGSNTITNLIGAGQSQGFDGKFYGLRIYSGLKLTSEQAKKLYNGINITDNLVCYLKFNEREGKKIDDYSGYGFTGNSVLLQSWVDKDIRCWDTRWDEENYNVIIETFIDACDRNYLANRITPAAVTELYNILGVPHFIDLTYSSSNSLIAEPISGFGISGLRERRVIAVKNYTDHFINPETYGIKIEGSIINL